MWLKWMHSRMAKIPIRFVFRELAIHHEVAKCRKGQVAPLERGAKMNRGVKPLARGWDAHATRSGRSALRISEKLLTGRSLLTGGGVRGSKGFAVRGFKRIMRCPKCTGADDKVIDSRTSRDGLLIRRRRECLKCGAWFTTYEEIFREKLRVKKRNSQYEEFDRRKMLAGLEKACEKRPVSTEDIELLAERVITELENEFGREVPSKQIGERIMQHLRKLDEVAYVRFASVYRQFRDAEQFIDEIKQLGKS